MEQIQSFYLPQLHNGENVNFHRDSLEQLEKADVKELGVSEQVDIYRASYRELQESIDVFSASDLSAESTQRNQLRNRRYSAFKIYIKMILNDDDAEETKIAVAKRLLALIHQSAQELGNPLRLGLFKKSTALSSLLRNLETLSADINLIGAERLVIKLRDANQSFIDLQFNRYIEQSNKHSGDVKVFRVVSDGAYKTIIECINAQILLSNDKSLFASYVKAQNAVVEKYKNHVAQRKGRAKKKEEEKGGTEERENGGIEKIILPFTSSHFPLEA
jgi:hypothetical protein